MQELLQNQRWSSFRQQLKVGAIMSHCKVSRFKCDKVPVSASDKIHATTILRDVIKAYFCYCHTLF